MEMDERSNLVQRAAVREAVWGQHRFLGEEGREEDKGGKKAGCSPWRMVGRVVGIAALVATSALTGIVGGIVTLGGIAAVTVLAAKESSPPSPPQWTEASSEPA